MSINSTTALGIAAVAILLGVVGTLYASYEIAALAFAAAGGSGALPVIAAVVVFVVSAKVIGIVVAFVLQLVGGIAVLSIDFIN